MALLRECYAHGSRRRGRTWLGSVRACPIIRRLGPSRETTRVKLNSSELSVTGGFVVVHAPLVRVQGRPSHAKFHGFSRLTSRPKSFAMGTVKSEVLRRLRTILGSFFGSRFLGGATRRGRRGNCRRKPLVCRDFPVNPVPLPPFLDICLFASMGLSSTHGITLRTRAAS